MRRRAFRDAFKVRNAGIFYALGALLTVLVLIAHFKGQPFYLRPVNAVNILEQTSLLAIVAIFSTVVLISGNFDLSIASTAALSMLVTIELVEERGLVVAVLGALVAATAVGVLNATLVQKLGINSFIVTLGTLTAVRGLILVVTNGQSVALEDQKAIDSLSRLYYPPISTPNLLLVAGALLLAAAVFRVWRSGRASAVSPLGAALAVGGAALLVAGAMTDARLQLVRPVWLMLAVALATTLVLRGTVVGRRLYAVGGSAEAARLSGIKVGWYKSGAFVAMALAAGIVGVLYAAQLTALNPNALQGLEFTAITAAVLGGTSLYGGSGTAVKSVGGALFLITLQNGFNVINLGPNWQSLVEGTVIIVAVAVYTLAARRSSAPIPGDAASESDFVLDESDADPQSKGARLGT